MTPDRRTYTVPEAARALGLSRSSGYDAARRGDLPTIRIGHRILVSRAALDRLLDGSAPAAPQDRPAA